MSKPAARITDMHMCPLITPGIPPVPHIGGPLLQPGALNVLICGIPAATVGTMAMCTGATDVVISGSSKVFIGNMPAARVGDFCSHGGTLISGAPTVLLG